MESSKVQQEIACFKNKSASKVVFVLLAYLQKSLSKRKVNLHRGEEKCGEVMRWKSIKTWSRNSFSLLAVLRQVLHPVNDVRESA